MAGHDDSAYAGNHMQRADDKAFGVSSKDVEDPMKDVDLAPDLQINRRGVGEVLTAAAVKCHSVWRNNALPYGNACECNAVSCMAHICQASPSFTMHL